MGLTQDLDWLTQLQDGFEVTGNDFILEMARFWESRPTYSEEEEQWEINGLCHLSTNDWSMFNIVTSAILRFSPRCDAS